ncbi:MAG: hypothetical protein M3Y77_21820 [Actinomycetota bacterium]|nr:hypothetical protein [Actinomycetota bacterium]
MAVRYHVSSALNRGSIRVHGLDWRYMKAAPGIAGSRRPEQEGCFLGEAHDVDWFVRMNNTGGPVDVWEVSDVVIDDLLASPEGYCYLPTIIGPDRLRLVQQDIPPETAE